METLTIKELAPYLPYGLKCETELGVLELTEITTIGRLHAWFGYDGEYKSKYFNSEILCSNGLRGKGYYLNQIKPLLKPLSSINENIFSEIKKCHEYEGWNEGANKEIGIEYLLQNIKPEHLEYWMVDKLHEFHFDTKNLIGRNLAIDLNTIKETVK